LETSQKAAKSQTNESIASEPVKGAELSIPAESTKEEDKP